MQFLGLTYNDDLNVELHSGGDADRERLRRGDVSGRPARLHASSISARRGSSAETSQAFFGVQNMFDKVYFVADEPVDDRHAAPGQRRRAGSASRDEMTKKPRETRILLQRSAAAFVSGVGVSAWAGA